MTRESVVRPGRRLWRSRTALLVVLAVVLPGVPVLPVLPAAATDVCSSFATGGSPRLEVLAGDEYCLHVFSQVGTSSFSTLDPRITSVDYVVVGGGGGGGPRDVSGGGGAGGVVTNLTLGSVAAGGAGLAVVPGQPVTVTVGAGGAGGTSGSPGGSGAPGAASGFGSITAAGGGGGAHFQTSGGDGASGGGAGRTAGTAGGAAVPAGQGNPGGDGLPSSSHQGAGGGGGGAGGAGGTAALSADGSVRIAGVGGPGIDLRAALGDGVGDGGFFAGGGGGSTHRDETSPGGGTGGKGGGGSMGVRYSGNGGAGVAGTGGGGGASRNETGSGGRGGSGVVIVRYRIPPVTTSTVTCDGTSTQAGLTVTAGHGQVLYLNTGQGERIDAGYVAYRVQSATARSDLWVEVADFTGGVVVPADPTQTVSPLGEVSAGGSGSAFFMVTAAKATKAAQSHRVNVYARRPVPGVTRPLASCSYTFLEVQETIRSNANRVSSISATSGERIGSEMVITVEGDTGLIGQGNRIDGRMIWLSPAARSDWPVSSLRLEKVEIRFYAEAERTTLLSTHTDTLRINASTLPALSATRQQHYTATYRFRIIGSAAATAPVAAFSMISSGTQVKHTDLRALVDGVELDLTSVGIDVTLQKDVRTTTVVDDDGTTVTYDLDLVNAGTDDLVVDEIVDTPDEALTLVAGSVTYHGGQVVDPTSLSDGGLRFSGPFTLPAGARRTLTYEMRTATCAPGGCGTFSVASGQSRRPPASRRVAPTAAARS